jgi:phenylalanyl-tRNA synthetase alpha chain
MSSDLSQVHINELSGRFDRQLSEIQRPEDVDLLRRDWLGKEGAIKELFKKLRDVSVEEKPTVAAALNQLKERVESELETKDAGFKSKALFKQLDEQYLDLSLPEAGAPLGAVHPVTIVEERITTLLRPFGFQNVNGPEVETDYYCFDSLNIPKHHPARDMQDTFYTETGHVLRTHTTSVQARMATPACPKATHLRPAT